MPSLTSHHFYCYHLTLRCFPPQVGLLTGYSSTLASLHSHTEARVIFKKHNQIMSFSCSKVSRELLGQIQILTKTHTDLCTLARDTSLTSFPIILLILYCCPPYEILSMLLSKGLFPYYSFYLECSSS